MNPIRILVVDDHSVVRQGICSLLSNYDEFDVVGEATNGRSALTQFKILLPDVTLLDIRMPEESGLQVLEKIRQVEPDAKIVMLSSFDDDEYVDTALRAGAKGYVLKSGSDQTLVNAIHSATRNERFLSPQVTERIVERLMLFTPEKTAVSPIDLNDEERRILKLLVDGLSNVEIGEALFISSSTVKRKLSHIFEKMNVQTRTQAAGEAVRQGLA